MPARFARLERYTVPGFDVRHVFPDLHNDASRLMTQHKRRLDHIVADRARFIIMQIAAAHTDVFDPNQRLVILWLRNRTLFKRHLSNSRHDGRLHHAFHTLHTPFLFLKSGTAGSDRGFPPVLPDARLK